MSEFRAEDVVRIGNGSYKGYQAVIRRAFDRMVDVKIHLDPKARLLARPIYTTFRISDAELVLVQRPRPA